MQKVHLMGPLSQFGSLWNVKAKYIRDVFKLISCQTPGFKEYLKEAVDNGADIQIKRGSEIVTDEKNLLLSLGKDDLFISLVPSGSKSNVGKIITGAILIWVGMQIGLPPEVTAEAGSFSGLTTAQQIQQIASLATIGIGMGMISQGVAGLLVPGPETDGEKNEGYLFDGPINTTQQGLPVPVLYGELIVGGATISTTYTQYVPSSITDNYFTSSQGAFDWLSGDAYALDDASSYNGGNTTVVYGTATESDGSSSSSSSSGAVYNGDGANPPMAKN